MMFCSDLGRWGPESVLGPSAIITRLLTSPRLWVILYCDFPPAIFHRCTGSRFLSCPHPPPEELKCSCNLWLIRQQRCLWPSQCHHVCNPALSLSHTLCRGHRDERMMDAYFPAALEAAMTPTRRTAALLQSVWPLSGEKSPHLLLSTHQSGKAHNIYIEHTTTHSHTRQK